MSRVKIEEPDQYIFKANIRTRITDLNYGGHVGNDRIFAFMHDARVQFFKSLGYENELNFEGLGNIQTDAAITYKAEVFAHEDIEIAIGIKDINKYGCDFVYKFMKSDGSLAALGKTGVVFFDYEKRKIASIPKSFLEKIK
ncbi:thioesterase family protein [Marivirga salinae]|uniref:Thioesterase family protein n=1 Tax=Marivirga salinarum TaxID=3059078 RepID=A0AA49GHT1_9BACT|nr:thioesterase family protein [Marivirga sp. BDSF4-3]WKK78441.2 thioesterase family protein [Marivirga sp. BDSF4-3]